MKSRHKVKNHVRFKGDFKKEVQGEFPGRDLSEIIAERLKQKNYKVNSVKYDEPWFTIKVFSGSLEYSLLVSRNVMKENYWEISCPRTLRFFARLCGQSEEAELLSIVNVLDEILRDEKRITDIKWYEDYAELIDDYAEKPLEKYLNVIGKYFEKLFLPLCATGWVLGLIGGIRSGQKSLLLRIGVIVFLLPIATWFALGVINFAVALVYKINDSCQKKPKKK